MNKYVNFPFTCMGRAATASCSDPTFTIPVTLLNLSPFPTFLLLNCQFPTIVLDLLCFYFSSVFPSPPSASSSLLLFYVVCSEPLAVPLLTSSLVELLGDKLDTNIKPRPKGLQNSFLV